MMLTARPRPLPRKGGLEGGNRPARPLAARAGVLLSRGFRGARRGGMRPHLATRQTGRRGARGRGRGPATKRGRSLPR